MKQDLRRGSDERLVRTSRQWAHAVLRSSCRPVLSFRRMRASLQHVLSRAAALIIRLSDMAEANPRRAWMCALVAVLVVVGWETAFWPLNHYPGAIWHKSPRGLDIEIPQQKAAHMGWPELASYWVGGQIEGNGYYRPLTSWLFVGEYHLFGTNDAAWSNVNIFLHLSAIVAVLWFVALIRPGPLLARLATGALACVFIGGPWFADRQVHYWTIGWWPAQPENITLLCTLGMLGSVVLYTRTGRRRYATLLPLLLLIGVCFKEMTYVGGIGACLFLVRQRKQWKLLFGFASFMAALLIFRHFVLPDGQGLLIRPGHFQRFAILSMSSLVAMGDSFTWSDRIALISALVAATGAGKLFRKTWNWCVWGSVLVAVYAGVGLALTDASVFAANAVTLLEVLFYLAVAYCLIRRARHWPVPELILLYFGASWVVAGYPPYFGWYRLWPGVFASILAAIAWAEWLGAGWKRLRQSSPIAQRVPTCDPAAIAVS